MASSKEPVQREALVVLEEDNLPPSLWKMGRIQDLHPDSDGCVRVISVKTNNGVVKRTLNKKNMCFTGRITE